MTAQISGNFDRNPLAATRQVARRHDHRAQAPNLDVRGGNDPWLLQAKCERRVSVRRDMIVLVAGEPPIYGKQPMYFLDPKLLERAQIPAPRAPDKIVHADKEARDGDEIDQALAAC